MNVSAILCHRLRGNKASVFPLHPIISPVSHGVIAIFLLNNERPPYALTLSVAFPGSCPDFMKTQLASPLLKLVLGRIQCGWAESTSHPAIWSGPIHVHEGCHVATQCTNKQKPSAFQSWAINNLAKLIQNTSLNSETELRRKWCVCLSSRAELNTADGKRVQVLT